MGSAPKPWEVQQDPTQGDPSAPEVSSAPQDIIDENDPRLVSETMEVNVDADAYAQPAPPPDAKYRAKLKLEGVKQDGTTERKDYTSRNFGKPPQPAYTTSISCKILDSTGRYDGLILYPAFGGGANTSARKDGSSQVATILARLKKPDGTPWVTSATRMNQKEWMELFIKVLATEPEIGVQTAWEASCRQCGDDLKPQGKFAARTQGMNHFPMENDAAKRKLGQTHSPEIKCAVNAGHGYARARAIVVSFHHLSELKAGT